MIQHNAVKFVTNKYPKKGHYGEFSVTDLIEELQLDTLESRREHTKLTMAYKIRNGHVILSPDLLPSHNHNRPTRSCNQVRVCQKNQLSEPHTTLHNAAETFFYSVSKLWNTRISPEQAESPSVNSFKNYFNPSLPGG